MKLQELIEDSSLRKLIEDNIQEDPSNLALKLQKLPQHQRNFVVEQVKGHHKMISKAPSLVNRGLIYPPATPLEQASSEMTARYKASLMSGTSACDLTAGMGIDSIFISRKFKDFTSVEMREDLCEILSFNLTQLGQNHSVVQASAEEFLEVTEKKFDWIYIDPSRRIEGQKVFTLDRCEPNITDLLVKFGHKSNRWLIKLSPLIDISSLYRELSGISKVIITSVQNEVKEVLVIIDESNSKDEITCSELNEAQKFEYSFQFGQESDLNTSYGNVGDYLYLPGNAILKSGGFRSLCQKFDLQKLSSNTHLFTSQDLVSGFPGRAFKVREYLNYKSSEFKSFANISYTIILKNFPDNLTQLKKKLGVKEGNESYLFAFRDSKEGLKICLADII